MITPSYSLTATERVLPRLALDFTIASLDSRITFARALNTATRVNNNGYVETVNADLPRFDYDPITLACKGLLIEESRANLFLQSENFSATWSTGNASISPDNVVSPSNLLDADTLIPANGVALSSCFVQQSITKAASAITYTYSCFAKANGFNGLGLYIRDLANAGNRATVTFSLATGAITVAAAAVGTWTAASAAVTPFGNGWYRLSLTFTSSTETSILARFYADDSTIPTGDGVKGVALWGAQLEAGAFPTSYTPTTTTSLTRNADVATMTGTNFSDWFNPVEGTFSVTGILGGVSTNRDLLVASDGTGNNAINIRWASGSQAQFSVAVGGASQASIAPAGYSTIGTPYKRVAAYKLDSFAQGINGTLTGTDTAGTIPTVDRLYIGASSAGIVTLNGWVRNIYYYPQRLINAEVTAFSK